MYRAQLPLTICFLLVVSGGLAQPPGADVLDEGHNREVTALAEDCESVRLAIGAAWDDALDGRALSGYLRPWNKDDSKEAVEETIRHGMRLYELLKCVDDGIQSVRLVRDARDPHDERQLLSDLKFWRNELGLAAQEVIAYAAEATSLRNRLAGQLQSEVAARGIRAEQVPGMPWPDGQREAWRRAGPAIGVRLPLEPFPDSYPQWWNRHLSLGPGYLVGKLHAAGDLFFTDETPIGAWGHNCPAKGRYDWAKCDQILSLVRDRGGKLLLELPTLLELLDQEQIAAMRAETLRQSSGVMALRGYAPSLPADLARDPQASLVTRDDDGKLRPQGGVQLFHPPTAAAYGEYLQALAAHLKSAGLYETVAAIHVEMGDSAELPENVDYSQSTRLGWQKFLESRYRTIAELNRSAGADYRSFADVEIPFRVLSARVAGQWEEFRAASWRRFLKDKYRRIADLNKRSGQKYKTFDEVPLAQDRLGESGLAADWNEFRKIKPDARTWQTFLLKKYEPDNAKGREKKALREATLEILRQKLGDDFEDGPHGRLPYEYPPGLKIDYLHFRRQWVHDYLAIKRGLVEAAFPDKLVIAEMRQFGDHEGIQGKSEPKWGGFLSDDLAQWSGVGPENDRRPFMLRSVGPVGFGTRPSDSLESLFRDYLWLNFRNPGNLARYFYDWVAHGYMDYQLGWHSVTNHWLTNRLLYQLGPTVANTQPQPQPIGLLLPRTTLDLGEGPSYYPYMGWDWLLQAAKLPYTRIDEHFVRDGRLAELGLKVLILPEAAAMDNRVAAEIARWVAAGGLLVASNVPAIMDEYGQRREKSALADVLGASSGGRLSEAVAGTPLGITIPHGFFSGGSAESTARRPLFETLAPTNPQAEVLARYEGGRPAIVLNKYGKGRAATMGYPFGREAVECERTSIGFQRTYVWFAREPQLLARTAWLRKFLVEDLGVRREYDVTSAEVQRPKGRDAMNPSLAMPKGLSQDPASPWYVRTVGDPRPGHEIELQRESPDMALRYFPRFRSGLATRYLGISTREVHYLSPRATANMVLSRHVYSCRINNPKIRVIWDIGRNVPVGFAGDEHGVAFDVSLPSGQIMMLAISETPKVEFFPPAAFPGRGKEEMLARCKQLAGGNPASAVTMLTPAAELRDWAKELALPVPRRKGAAQKQTVLISYGQPANQPAAEKLAAVLRERYGVDVATIEQSVETPEALKDRIEGFEKPVVLIGDEWTNNDMAMHGAYWGIAYGAHMPFTATYAWPGQGRAVVALSRRYALMDANGRQPFDWQSSFDLRPVEPRFPLLRRKLHVAANGADAERAIDAVIASLQQ